jgi:hypothetical protein
VQMVVGVCSGTNRQQDEFPGIHVDFIHREGVSSWENSLGITLSLMLFPLGTSGIIVYYTLGYLP